ncbi:MAG: ABC transporter substrate-binding protein [Chloroflexota bacterium]|nr:ABC transporter substrate-binding protein [Chloroflexota bacterium]
MAPLLAALAIVVAACGSATPSTPPAGGSTGPSGGPATPLPSTPASTGGTLSIAFEGDIATFDPAIGYDVTTAPVEHMLYDSLLAYDSGTKLIPGLASEMPTLSADGLTYTFKLRSGVQFVKSDGTVLREMTADDVVHSLNRILDPKLTPRPSPVGPAFFTLIAGGQEVVEGKAAIASGLKVIDPLTVEISLREPNRAFLNILAMTFGSILPKEVAGVDTGAFSANPVGTGPFYLKSYIKGQLATFQRNEHYFRDGFPKADTGEVRVQVDPTTQLQQVQAGQLDIMGNELPAGAFTATVNDPALKDQVIREALVAINYLAIDTSGPSKELSNVKVRQAMAHAIDKENLRRVANDRGVVANCIFPPQISAFDPGCNPYPFDVAKAKALMKEAGVTSLSTQLFTDTTPLSKTYSEAIVQDLAEIGITAELVQQDFDVLLGTIQTPHAAPLVYIGWFQDFPDPSDFYDPFLSCATAVEGGANASFYCNEANDKLAADARREPDETKRNEMYRQLQAQVMADVPYVPTTHPDFVFVVSKRAQGVALHPVWWYDLPVIGVSE